MVDYDYAVNDYNGNEQTRREHVEPEKQVGDWSARMADGAMHTVKYEAGPYGNLAHVIVRHDSYATPTYKHSAYKRSVPYGAVMRVRPMYVSPAYSNRMYTSRIVIIVVCYVIDVVVIAVIFHTTSLHHQHRRQISFTHS